MTHTSLRVLLLCPDHGMSTILRERVMDAPQFFDCTVLRAPRMPSAQKSGPPPSSAANVAPTSDPIVAGPAVDSGPSASSSFVVQTFYFATTSPLPAALRDFPYFPQDTTLQDILGGGVQLTVRCRTQKEVDTVLNASIKLGWRKVDPQ